MITINSNYFINYCCSIQRRQWQWTPILLPGKSYGPRTEEPGRQQSVGSWRVRHNWATSLSLFTFMHWRRNGNPLQWSCLENPRDGRAWWAAVYGIAQSWTWLTRISSSSMVHWVLCQNCSDDIHGQDFKLAAMLNFSRMYVWNPRRAPPNWS